MLATRVTTWSGNCRIEAGKDVLHIKCTVGLSNTSHPLNNSIKNAEKFELYGYVCMAMYVWLCVVAFNFKELILYL